MMDILSLSSSFYSPLCFHSIMRDSFCPVLCTTLKENNCLFSLSARPLFSLAIWCGPELCSAELFQQFQQKPIYNECIPQKVITPVVLESASVKMLHKVNMTVHNVCFKKHQMEVGRQRFVSVPPHESNLVDSVSQTKMC